MHKLVLLRHGQSVWNKANRFTGWTDVELTAQGASEALEAAQALQSEGFKFDVAYTSVLKRAIKTLWIVLEEMGLMWIPVHRDWRLNERHYGALQGLNKGETVDRYGIDQVQIWRRSYETLPPPLTLDDERFPGKDNRYDGLSSEEMPLTECLKDTIDRFMPYWEHTIVPQVNAGKKVLIVAHGNSLRALVKFLDGLSSDEILSVNIPTGIPLVYELNEGFKPTRHYYLGDPKKVAMATQVVANQLEQQ